MRLASSPSGIARGDGARVAITVEVTGTSVARISSRSLSRMTLMTSVTEGPYAWEREVKIVATPDLDVEGRATKWRMWAIDVRVTWGDRQVSVATLRTVAGDGDGDDRRPRP